MVSQPIAPTANWASLPTAKENHFAPTSSIQKDASASVTVPTIAALGVVPNSTVLLSALTD